MSWLFFMVSDATHLRQDVTQTWQRCDHPQVGNMFGHGLKMVIIWIRLF